MAEFVYIKDDLVSLRPDHGEPVGLVWGDQIEVLGRDGSRIRVHGRGPKPIEGTVKGKVRTQPTAVLQFSMVDVQQGDGMVIETPKGRKILIDGGDNVLFARYCAARYPNTTAQDPLEVDAMVVTHGDADHFAGLTQIKNSEKEAKSTDTRRRRKALFIHPKRVFHNGLVKGPSTLTPEKIFGTTRRTRDGRAVTALEEDLIKVNAKRLNRPFKSWVSALKHWRKRGPIQFQRLEQGNKSAFKFLADEGITVDVHGPITRRVTVAGKSRKALPLLHDPPKTVELHLEDQPDPDRAFSASHTINGHSVTLRLHYGNVR